MTKQEILQNIDKCKAVMAYVQFTADDGDYVKVSKAEFLFRIAPFQAEDKINAEINNKVMYIN